MPASYSQFPKPSEYAPFYQTYINHLAPCDIIEALALQIEETEKLLRPLTEAQADYAYASGKWTIKQVVGHLIEGERVFSYRALRFSRNDRTPLPGFDQDEFMQAGNAHERPLHALLDEFVAVRQSTLALLKGFSDEMMDRKGNASGMDMTVRALAHVIAGHERHHVATLRARYLS